MTPHFGRIHTRAHGRKEKGVLTGDGGPQRHPPPRGSEETLRNLRENLISTSAHMTDVPGGMPRFALV